MSFVAECFKDYIMDLLMGRIDPFVFKTAEFCKRNFNSVKSTCSHLMYELRKVKMGFIKMKNDIGFAVGFNKKQF